MERTGWVLLLLAIAAACSFGDAVIAALLRPLGSARREPAPEGLLDLMARDLASGEPRRVERATAAFLRIPGPSPVPYLTGLLRHQRSEVSRQAAYILYERQDADGLPPLYQYLSSVSA